MFLHPADQGLVSSMHRLEPAVTHKYIKHSAANSACVTCLCVAALPAGRDRRLLLFDLHALSRKQTMGTSAM